MRSMRQASLQLLSAVAHASLSGRRQASGSAPTAPPTETVKDASHAPKSIHDEMRSRGFEHETPSFSVDFSNVPAAADLAADITSSPAVGVDFARDLYGPWLVMTEDLQGELYIDHDHFVFYRPANGLGYGIGTMEDVAAGAAGTAFMMHLEVYGYQQTATTSPTHGLRLDVTGMIKKVSAGSSGYQTLSLVGAARKASSVQNSTNSAAREPAAAGAKDSGADHSDGGDAAACSQFNAAKLSPWDAKSAPAPWTPNEQLSAVFQEVFPHPLELRSHRRRAEEKRRSVETSSSASAVDLGVAPQHLDLQPYAVGSIPSVFYIPNYIDEAEEAQILSRIKSTPAELKSKIPKRTVQEWGCTMCDVCKQSFVSDANMPAWVQQSADMLTYDGIFSPSTFPNSVRIHEYEREEGIGPHCDGPIYVPQVAVLSLASTTVMNFYPRQELYHDHPMDHYNDTFKFADGTIGRQRPLQTVVMEPRSLLIFSGDAYYYHPHGVSDKAVDHLSSEESGEVVNRHLLENKDIERVERRYRASITTRNLLTRCNHQPTRAEYQMKRAWYVYNQQPVPHPLFSSSAVDSATSTAQLPSSRVAEDIASPRSFASAAPAGPLTSEQLQRWEQKLDRVLSQQAELRKTVEDLQQVLLLSMTSGESFRKETSTVLNHLSTSVLDVDAKVDDLVDLVRPDNKSEN